MSGALAVHAFGQAEVEAPGIEPGSENASPTPLRTYPAIYLALGLACRRALPSASPLFVFASPPGDPAFGYPARLRPREGAGGPFLWTAFSAV